MPKPVTPLVGCDVFVLNEKNEVLLIRRADNGFWALPGGCQDLGETPAEAAARECLEESGYSVKIMGLLGIFSSMNYEYIHYPWKENEFMHILFQAEVTGGQAKVSTETTEIGWYAQNILPELSDGHGIRVEYGFKVIGNTSLPTHFE